MLTIIKLEKHLSNLGVVNQTILTRGIERRDPILLLFSQHFLQVYLFYNCKTKLFAMCTPKFL